MQLKPNLPRKLPPEPGVPVKPSAVKKALEEIEKFPAPGTDQQPVEATKDSS